MRNENSAFFKYKYMITIYNIVVDNTDIVFEILSRVILDITQVLFSK